MSKIQIRNNIFETNSSSTHSFSFSKNAMSDISDKLFEDIDIDNGIDISTYIVREILYWPKVSDLVYIPDDDESRNAYIILNSWFAKLTWLENVLVTELQYKIDYDYREGERKLYEKIRELDLYKEFEKMALKYVNEKGYKCTVTLPYDEDSLPWCGFENHVVKDEKNWLLRTFNELMQDEVCVIDATEAYNPYNGIVIKRI